MIVGPSNPPVAAPSPTAPSSVVSPVQLACSDFLSCPQHRPLVYGLSCMLQVGQGSAALSFQGYHRSVCWKRRLRGVTRCARCGSKCAGARYRVRTGGVWGKQEGRSSTRAKAPWGSTWRSLCCLCVCQHLCCRKRQPRCQRWPGLPLRSGVSGCSTALPILSLQFCQTLAVCRVRLDRRPHHASS